jgi:hypothetical protein
MQFFIALDQLVNTLFGGWADETLSARCWRENRWFRHVIDLMFFWQTGDNGKWNHCEQCYWHERKRMDLPPEYRTCEKCEE